MFGPKGPFCQSCGMPLSRDALGGGTNADGSRSAEYCSHCYRIGRFTEPNLAVEEMMAKVEGQAAGDAHPRLSGPTVHPGHSQSQPMAACSGRAGGLTQSPEGAGTHLIDDMVRPDLILRRPKAELFGPARGLEPPPA